MKKYIKREVSETQLEDQIRQKADLIEEGLKYVDHQRKAERGPLDILMVDSGNALVIAELKVVQDDGMLTQAIDYYDYITSNLEGMARAYKDFGIDPKQDPRLFLIAPSFSVTLLNRCKWINIPISLFSFQCIEFENEKGEVVPIFKEITIPSPPERVEIFSLEERLNYITDFGIRKMAKNLLEEIQNWDPNKILIEPIKYDISLKVSGRVFAYVCPRRKHFMTYTRDSENEWHNYPIKQEKDLEEAKQAIRENFERLK